MKPLDWHTAITQAKGLLGGRRVNQMRVAEIAMQVCEISWGGAKPEGRTLTDFAKEIGVNQSTLSNWVSIRRRVYEKLNPELRAKATTHTLIQAARCVGEKATSLEINKAVGDLVYDYSPDRKMLSYLRHLRSISSCMNDGSSIFLCKKQTLEEIKFFASRIIEALERDGPKGLKAKDNGLCGIACSNTLGAANGSVSRSWRMSEQDREVYDYIRAQTDKKTPIQVGRAVMKQDGPSLARQRCLRSLVKLEQMGLVVREAHGAFRARASGALK